MWPEALKSAEVIPIYNAGNKTDITNYRPISLISNIAKIKKKKKLFIIYEYIIL